LQPLDGRRQRKSCENGNKRYDYYNFCERESLLRALIMHTITESLFHSALLFAMNHHFLK
jgi:hypothetical protein